MTTDPITMLCDGLMRAVAHAGIVDPKDDAAVERAVAVIRKEAKAFVAGPEYADERACIMAGTVSQQTVLASLAASCLLKIKGADR